MKQHVLTGTLIALIVTGLALLVAVGLKLAPLLLLVLIAIVITTGISPMVDGLQRRWPRMPRGIATLLVLLSGLLVLYAALAVILYTAIRESIDFAQHGWPTLQPRLVAWLADLNRRYPALPSPDELLTLVQGQSGAIAGYLLTTTRTVVTFLGGLFSLVTVFFLTFFFTLEKQGITGVLLQFVPPAHRARWAEVGHLAADKMGGWLRGQIILALLITFLTAVGMQLLGMRYAMLLAIIAGLGELIPMVGPYLAFVPAIAIAILNPHLAWPQVIGVAVFFIALSQVENFYLSPRIMERHVELRPVTTIFALIAGGVLGGLVGAVLAIPLAAAGRVVLLEAVFPAIQATAAPKPPAPAPPSEMPPPRVEVIPVPEPKRRKKR
jgi:predicted PurR-regulated permease PerM